MGIYLITGLSGYIGSRLAMRLCRGNKVYGLVRNPLNTTYLNKELKSRVELLVYDGSYESMLAALEKSRPDAVWHLATHYTGSHDGASVKSLVHGNLELGAYLLEAMAATGCRQLVYATTITTRYTGEGYAPLSLYAATKQAFSDLVEFYTSAGLMRAAAVALSDTYGPGDRRPKILNLVRQAILEGNTLDLTHGEQPYCPLYVDDVICAFECTAQALADEGAPHLFFQPCGGERYTLRETVELLLHLNRLRLNANWGGRPEPERQMREAVCLYPPPPGWQQKVSLQEGLSRFWEDTKLFREESKHE